jgi:hypothetical protein
MANRARTDESSSRTSKRQAMPDIAKDNGFSAWVDANPTPYLDMELGYTRSVHYALNSVSFGVGVNVGYLTRRSRR